VQDYIKGLNFSYRVQLREAGITYLNKLGKPQRPFEYISTFNNGIITLSMNKCFNKANLLDQIQWK